MRRVRRCRLGGLGIVSLCGWLLLARSTPGEGLAPIVYTLRAPAPETHRLEVVALVPTEGRDPVDLMMPVWSPGFYRVEDYAGRVEALAARTPDGVALEIERPQPNRWRVRTAGQPAVVVSYRLVCDRRSVTTNWVDPDLAVLNGPATFVTLAERGPRPHEVRLELAPTWPRVVTALDPVPGGPPTHYRASDYDTLVDSPIVAGDLAVHPFEVDGVPHLLVDAGARGAWDGARAAADLRRLVGEAQRFWGTLLPYPRYVFLNVFRAGGGGLEHLNSTLLTANAERVATPRGYLAWLRFAAHEYVHAFNVKRLRPIELGPFDYERPPRTSSLWIAEGFTTYIAELLVTRAGLADEAALLEAVSDHIRQLQTSPGRLVQTLESSSLEVWTTGISGVGQDREKTISYYVKGPVVAFLLDAHIRGATGGRRSLDDVMRLAYARYAGPRGFTPEEFRATAEAVAGVNLREWFRRAVASTEELDYSEALEWFGLRFAAPADPARAWALEVRPDATAEQRARLQAWAGGGPAGPRLRLRQISVRAAVRHDVSPPLAVLAATVGPDGAEAPVPESDCGGSGRRCGLSPPALRDEPQEPRGGAAPAARPRNPAGAAIEQTSQGPRPPARIVERFDGLGFGFEGPHGPSLGRNPSDNSLAVGPDHIVQTVNSRLAVFTKKGARFGETGRAIYGAVPTNTVFAGFGGTCEARNNGDAVVRYDQLADRWLVVMPIFRRSLERPDQPEGWKPGAGPYVSPPGVAGQPGPAATLFVPPPAPPSPEPGAGAGRQAQPGSPPPQAGGGRGALPAEKGPYSICYAVSTTPDPLGPYYRYEFLRPLFPDYPRPAVWPDGYYVATSTGDDVIEKHLCVADRVRMLEGQPAREQCFVVDGVNFLNPADLDGRALPPPGAPAIVMATGGTQLQSDFDDDGIYVWQVRVNWDEPAKTRMTGPTKIPVAPYHYLCNGQLTHCVPQPGTGRRLDAQGDKIMARVVYRNVDGRESIVAVHSVDTEAGGGGVRWYEFAVEGDRRVVLRQQGTYAPDGFYRWMASPAIDRFGNIGIGYSFGGAPHFPGQRFAGRLAGDPPGRLTLQEAILVEGEAAQTTTMRWEDYTQTAVDPTDDCTIWYVGDYYKKDAPTYSTRIGAFRLPGCPG